MNALCLLITMLDMTAHVLYYNQLLVQFGSEEPIVGRSKKVGATFKVCMKPPQCNMTWHGGSFSIVYAPKATTRGPIRGGIFYIHTPPSCLIQKHPAYP